MSALSLILGSTSAARRELLNRLQIPYQIDTPAIDETRQANESAYDMVARLSLQKAQAVAARHPNSLIIGSDQCALLGNNVLGKPHKYENAMQQLRNASGNTLGFLTGLCLYNSQDQSYQLDVIPFDVTFRSLTDAEIDCYLRLEQPYNCAGSFKSEGLGISLFAAMHGDDPTALMGLPLIRLNAMLRAAGINVLQR